MNKNEFYANIKSMKHIAKKSIGQNFIFDSETCEKIADSLNSQLTSNVLEIGPGLGSLSLPLSNNTRKLTLVDIDPIMINNLKSLFSTNNDVTIIQQNILKTDISKFDYIIGNLPYYITTDIIEYILTHAYNAKRVVLMVQKEVYARLKADIKSEQYNPISIYISHVAQIKQIMNVSRHVFAPEPHVDSLLFSIDFDLSKHTPESVDLYYFIKNIFLHRRKTIQNNLKSLGKSEEEIINALNSLNIPPNKRPEELTIDLFIKLQNVLKYKRKLVE